MIEYRDFITREMLQAEPDVLFVFGDNFERRGLGGQAKAMRGEPNSVGIPTKRAPTMMARGFLKNQDFLEWISRSEVDVLRLLHHKGKIVWPKAGIGTGLARLLKNAPLIWAEIELIRIELGRNI